MKDYFDAVRDQLVVASERMPVGGSAVGRGRGRGRRGWWQRSPRTLAIALAAFSVSATALAAITPWRPLFGSAGSPQPSVTYASPLAEQMSMLGVLRRSQTDEDRGSTTRAALRYFGPSTQDIYTDYIRLLPTSTLGLQAILVPARSWDAGELEKRDVVCLFIAEAVASEGGAKLCSTTTDIGSGLASGALGSVAFGLVPDDVAHVVLRYRDGQSVTASVRDNFYEVLSPSRPVAGGGTTADPPSTALWFTADGSLSPTQPLNP